MTPSVSIVTPTYNRGHLLPRVWASLSRQTEQNFQWIVVDDGSTDDTRRTVSQFADPRICYVSQSNTGVNGARNRGDQEIKADFVIYLDSDDELYDDITLEQMLAEIKATRPEIAWVAFTVVDEKGQAGLSHLQVDRFESNYIDHVCERKISGEFFPIYRRDATSGSPWPPFNGLEALRHWQIVRQRPVLIINRPARVYHRQGGDALTGAQSALRRAPQMAQATAQLIAEHRDTWLQHCPCQVGKYSFYRGMYLAISGPGHKAVKDLLVAISYGDGRFRLKAIGLLFSLVFPLSWRKQLFLVRAGGNKQHITL